MSSVKHWRFVAQVCFGFLISGCGFVLTGMLLDTVQVSLPQICALLPALLGLKGNLEMTLVSRLSTLVNKPTFNC
ncbi:unnamed protein product [Soboliphyme baturini]|uniref:MFS transporter n=1 Tax=Soboliphyme baturini TaxID=241478 RepID=A0A183I9G1_9BILA|nr:unnamed protein product [Soboliphyme baturini]